MPLKTREHRIQRNAATVHKDAEREILANA